MTQAKDPRNRSVELSKLKENAELIGADGHGGNLDRVEGKRIGLTKTDSERGHVGLHHYLDLNPVAEAVSETIKLSSNAYVALTFEDVTARELYKTARSPQPAVEIGRHRP